MNVARLKTGKWGQRMDCLIHHVKEFGIFQENGKPLKYFKAGEKYTFGTLKTLILKVM